MRMGESERLCHYKSCMLSQTPPSNLPSTHVYRTIVHNPMAQVQEMYDLNSKIRDEVTEVSGYILGVMESLLSISNLREVADRMV